MLNTLEPARCEPEPAVRDVLSSKPGSEPVGGYSAKADAGSEKRPLVVLKLGGSILHDPADAAKVASEAYRVHRQGARVVAVVSALSGHTDSLLAEARANGCEHENRFTPHLVALGEARTAALAAMACERVGMRAAVLSPQDLKLLAEGPPEHASLVSMDRGALEAALSDHDVVVVPGYAGVGANSQPVLLGRGGTDLTAVFIAAEARADRVRLVKDVPGVFDRDPAEHGGAARLFEELSWDDAAKVAGELIQLQAVTFARDRKVKVEVAGVGAARASVVGPKSAAPGKPPQPRPLRVALAGCGVVGLGVAHRLLDAPEAFELVGVLVRDASKPRDRIDPKLLTDSAYALLAAEPDVVVDALSDADAGRALQESALGRGVSVVTANKQALVEDLAGLHALCQSHGGRLAYSAAVGGGCPMVEVVRGAHAAGPVASVEAVLNGTVNFILDRMAHGAAFADALAAAQAAGFAEEDPSADLDGRDAAAKIRILAYEAFGRAPAEDDVKVEPLDADRLAEIAESGGVWKQVAVCRCDEADKLHAEVRLFRCASGSDPLFYSADRERNALRVEARGGRAWTALGKGAGRWPTSMSVYADLLDMRADLLDA
ncbi:MAG: aspartate kinase [Maricaulaceae bacterium]|jgi:homoserine dehydrogenase